MYTTQQDFDPDVNGRKKSCFHDSANVNKQIQDSNDITVNWFYLNLRNYLKNLCVNVILQNWNLTTYTMVHYALLSFF